MHGPLRSLQHAVKKKGKIAKTLPFREKRKGGGAGIIDKNQNYHNRRCYKTVPFFTYKLLNF
ncbi:MAG: hypothetical protein A2007_03895 [Verrucomicrobia bacterium GWC2_42_7]|nr:MAG: hypothetical protein A2007_03895 [Verrucomicrobia bacterium GWC2_42_7]